jgi:hypothetical protein
MSTLPSCEERELTSAWVVFLHALVRELKQQTAACDRVLHLPYLILPIILN